LKPAKKIDTRITPSHPDGSLAGKVLYIRNNAAEAGQNQVIGISLGLGDGLKAGTALSIHRAGRNVKDQVAGGKVLLPEEKIGELLVLVAQTGGSLAMVVDSTSAINIGDAVRNQATR
jgi:delta 1-pyrroline-5-carboxylate dehydrogenase